MSDFDQDINKIVCDMGYDSCDEEWNGLRWFFLLSKVKAEENAKKDTNKKEKEKVSEKGERVTTKRINGGS